jgi:hypothetical protein
MLDAEANRSIASDGMPSNRQRQPTRRRLHNNLRRQALLDLFHRHPHLMRMVKLARMIGEGALTTVT